MPRPVWADWIWNAWNDLDGERAMIPVGMGGVVPGRIPWSSVDRWAARHGVDDGDFEFLVRALGAMDLILIQHSRK